MLLKGGMARHLINASISTQVLKFKPGEAPAVFEVTVINDSNLFATFQLEVLAPGADPNAGTDWYSCYPQVSTKKPPGDRTQFQIAIRDTPVPAFAGTINLTVRVFSLELRDEQRLVLRLIVEQGTALLSLKLELPVQSFIAYPREVVEIPVRVYNPAPQSKDTILKFVGLNPSWLNDGAERQLHLNPGEQKEVRFRCQLPIPARIPSQVYPFTIEAMHRYSPVSTVAGTLEALPMGEVHFSCTPIQHHIPVKQGWIPTWQDHPVNYALQFENHSNLHQQVSVNIRGKHQRRCTLQMMPDRASLDPGATVQTSLVVSKRRPWIGRPQQLLLEIAPVLSELRLGNAKPATQTVELHVLPVFPGWWQLVAGFLLLALLLCLWFLQPGVSHAGPVNSVHFNGLGNQVISGSDDQTMRSWSVQGNHLESQGILARLSKAVRVLRYRPVDNNLVAAGLENGQIQLWDPLSAQNQRPVEAFAQQQDDRVLSLAFTKDSRYLFSAHGSGLVLKWQLNQDVSNNFGDKAPSLQKKLDFAAYALAFVGEDEQTLAIAGRYNQLLLWDWFDNRRLRPLSYPKGGQDDYIYSLATAQQKPYLLATADNQGTIMLWDLHQCISENVDCKIVDQWPLGHGGRPVRSVALSADGCYLTSAGDDGRVMLWPLTSEGLRSPQFTEGKEIVRLPTTINSVDLIAVKSDILMTSGDEEHRVRLYRVSKSDSGCH